MAVPKGKVSKARRDKRRSSHWKLEVPGLVKCPKCGAMRLQRYPHQQHTDHPEQQRFWHLPEGGQCLLDD